MDFCDTLYHKKSRLSGSCEPLVRWQFAVNYITRSYDGDGLVARANQFYPKSFYNPVDKTTKKLLNNVYDPDPVTARGYCPVNANHADSDDADETKIYITAIVVMGKRLKP
ncbi:MAG: hypothetical protein LBF74_13405 [Treponema sp.]|nr:hypothetical protein [Treponema sp.]